MLEPLEDTLGRLRSALERAGEHDAAHSVVELQTAVAVATEMMAAFDRGDHEAMEFHSDLLARQVERARALKFQSHERE